MAVVAYNEYRARQDQAALKAAQDILVTKHGLVQPARKHLAPEYSDKDDRLVADPPSDPKQLLDPDTLTLAHYQDAKAKKQAVDWDALQTVLEKATGKKIIAQEFLNGAGEIAAIKAGKIQLVAPHAADTPYIVNNAGFVPFAVLGDEAGAHGNHLDLAVSAMSKIQTLADVRGHTLTCTAPDSITGYRAAVAVLSQEAAMRPDVDYFIIFSLGQKRSVEGLVGGDFEVAALSDDTVQKKLKDGAIKQSDYRVIYESQVIPRLTIGYVYNLKPELAAKVTAAVLDFKNEGGVAEETDKPMHFFAVDYKKDFEFVRNIDDSFDPRFSKAPKAKSPAAGSAGDGATTD
ncbi:MAG TPA: PhnD/SsuA/transferrin family substrate-binding protein [Pirellulales bacterium]|nr:PhnD/SsuA/transferrin family substrate-binding protein [Pirellulales bacterium]